MNELFAKLKNMRGMVAIEGASGSGKTTLAAEISAQFSATVVHMDDFYLPREIRTDSVAGNIDRARFLREVLIPLSKGEEFDYIRFDCKTQRYLEPVRISPAPLVIVEGAYSMHPEFAGFYEFSVFLTVSPEVQKMRILKRENADAFFAEWMPREKRYFEEFDIPNKCDMKL